MQQLGERDVRGVVDGRVLAQLPDSIDQRRVRRQTQRERVKVGERVATATVLEAPGAITDASATITAARALP